METIHPVADVTLHIGDLLFDSRLSKLLHLIEETGSVSRASEAMQITCSAAWEMLDDSLLLCTQEDTCTLSERGHDLLSAYDQYCRAICQKADDLYQKILQEILE